MDNRLVPLYILYDKVFKDWKSAGFECDKQIMCFNYNKHSRCCSHKHSLKLKKHLFGLQTSWCTCHNKTSVMCNSFNMVPFFLSCSLSHFILHLADVIGISLVHNATLCPSSHHRCVTTVCSKEVWANIK